MSESLQNQEIMKRRGMKDISMVEDIIKQLTTYLDVCPSAEVMEKVQDAVKELRKARLKIIERYEIDIDDLVKQRAQA